MGKCFWRPRCGHGDPGPAASPLHGDHHPRRQLPSPRKASVRPSAEDPPDACTQRDSTPVKGAVPHFAKGVKSSLRLTPVVRLAWRQERANQRFTVHLIGLGFGGSDETLRSKQDRRHSSECPLCSEPDGSRIHPVRLLDSDDGEVLPHARSCLL